MKNLVRFLVTLFMPILLIVAGGAIVGLGARYNMEILFYVGFGMIGAGILWGLAMFLWATNG